MASSSSTCSRYKSECEEKKLQSEWGHSFVLWIFMPKIIYIWSRYKPLKWSPRKSVLRPQKPRAGVVLSSIKGLAEF